jgi:hypothetical protein
MLAWLLAPIGMAKVLGATVLRCVRIGTPACLDE